MATPINQNAPKFKNSGLLTRKLINSLIDPTTGDVVIIAERKLTKRLVAKATALGLTIEERMLTPRLVDKQNRDVRNNPPMIMNARELGDYLGLSEYYARAIAKKSNLPFVRIGCHVKFRLADVNNWLKAKMSK